MFITAAELDGGRGALTDEAGSFDFTDLPAGRYTVSVSKSGFVLLSYGQRRPLQAGIPLQLGDGQQLRNVDFQLPRGSVIAGRDWAPGGWNARSCVRRSVCGVCECVRHCEGDGPVYADAGA